MDLVASTVAWIEKQVNENEPMVVALSGGPDSMLLLELAVQAAADKALIVEAAHVNHGLREAAETEEAELRLICEKRGIPFYSKRVDCARFAKENGMSLEEAGRRLRYAFFEEVLGDRLGWIATGHHRNDQAETVLFHLFRGTGARGFGGICALDPPMIRPLIDWKREEIMQAVEELGLPYFTDASNSDTTFTRNWIRHDLLPKIEERFDGGVVDRIVQASGLIAADDEYLRRQAEKIYETIADADTDGIRFQREALQALASPILSRVLLLALERVYGSTKDIQYSQMEHVMAMIRTGHSGRQFAFSQSRWLQIDSQVVSVGPEPEADVFKILLPVPGIVNVPGGKVVTEWVNEQDWKNDPFTIDIDYDRIHGRLFWRTQQSGDWFQLSVSSGRKRLKRFWIDQKIPRHRRDSWPLLADEERVLWVVGLRKCEGRPSSESRMVRVSFQVLEGGHHERGY